jgi:hypothetical protein
MTIDDKQKSSKTDPAEVPDGTSGTPTMPMGLDWQNRIMHRIVMQRARKDVEEFKK